jgi:hypothetical protein
MSYNVNAIEHPIKKQFLDLIALYVQEGEHQDGDGFWDNFHNGEQVAEDFHLFIAFEGEKQLKL